MSCVLVSPQVCPSTRSMETSSCAPQICCPSPTSTQTLALPFRCPSKKTWTTCRWFLSRLRCFTHLAKVDTHTHRHPFQSHCENQGLNSLLFPFVGERRIRVHTLCLPVVNSLSDIFAGADVQAISGLLACMGERHTIQYMLEDPNKMSKNTWLEIICLTWFPQESSVTQLISHLPLHLHV